MRSNLNNIQKFIESAFLVLLLLGLFVGSGSAASPMYPPLPTSYWGYVTNNSIPEPNALITVYNSSGNLVANATSNQDKQYQVTVPRYDPTTSPGGVVDGETITFKVDGQVATSRVVDLQGTNNRLDLAVPTATSTPPSSGGGGGGGSSSGGGGGGGGGTSGENYSNIIIKEKHDLFIFKDMVTSYRFNSTNPIIYVNITGNNNAGEINAMVEVLRDTSTIAKVPAPGTVYKNVNIWVGTGGFAVPRNIKEGIIGFKVTNSWLKSNNIGARDVSMYRWNITWGKLETKEIGSDTDFTYFEAKTNAFSPFAIVAGAPGTMPTETVPTPGGTATSTATEIIPTPPGTSSGVNLGIILALSIIVIIAVAAYYFLVVKKKEEEKK